MKIRNSKWIGAGLASLIIGVYSVSELTAQDENSEPAKEDLNIVKAEPEVHVHDENCNHDHAEESKPPTVDEIKVFLKAHADYILPEFEKVLKAEDEEHTQWIMKDISYMMSEYTALNGYDPKVAKVFVEALKLEHDIHQLLEAKLEAGETPEASGLAVKTKLKDLILKRFELQKGKIGHKKYLLDQDLVKLNQSISKIDDVAKEELKLLIEGLKSAQEEVEEKE